MGEQEEGRRSIRHAEKRRTSTCRFADRVAQVSVDHYHSTIPSFSREQQKQTCVATIVAHDSSLPAENNNNLIVLAMGVGTKFLPEKVLQQEHGKGRRYGERVRDCHAEVLARRAFRRRIGQEILHDLQKSRHQDDDSAVSRGAKSFTILQRCICSGPVQPPCYQLRSGISLHFYSSSAPCGNAVLKRFATLRKEKFRQDLAADKWPLETHAPIAGHAMPSGEFSLLVKKDSTEQSNSQILDKEYHNDIGGTAGHCQDGHWALSHLSSKQRQWPVNTKTDWCPPGTITVWSSQGSIHTCSDKLCRWNLLGLQGSLLSSLFVANINKDRQSVACDDSSLSTQMNAETYGWPVLSTLTVGRKLNAVTCRRAVCCRFGSGNKKNTGGKKRERGSSGMDWQVNHPAILGTSVYLDEHGFVETSETSGQDVRFHSAFCWAWWLADGDNKADDSSSLDCIDGTSGWAIRNADWVTGTGRQGSGRTLRSGAVEERVCSRISTAALVDQFLEIECYRKRFNVQSEPVLNVGSLSTLAELRALKHSVSCSYEKRKETILTEHPVFSQWNRRQYAHFSTLE